MPHAGRMTRKVPEYVRVEDAPGQRVTPGPFIGIIKNNFDPYHSGRLEVYIAELGGPDPDNPTNWKTVSYCTPFYGVTPNNGPSNGESFTSRHSYGMWFNPPDLEVRVLCIFVNGNPDNGFWFGCLPDRQNHHMVPGLAGTVNKKVSNAFSTKANSAAILPTIEFNDKVLGNLVNPSYLTIKKHPHDDQVKILIEQGLQGDAIRGVITSSSQRETPSGVFGISTPGRATPDEPATLHKPIKNRKGGHTFVMDDGDQDGNNQMFRLRSSSGHQLMLNDKEEILYIANATGTVWLQFHNDGNVELFAANNISIRTEKELDFHADGDIRINTGKKFQLYAADGIDIETKKQFSLLAKDKILQTTKSSFNISSRETRLTSDTNININAGSNIVEQSGGQIRMNSGAGPRAEKAKPIKKSTLDDAKFAEIWEFGKAKIENTIVKKAPTHEPYDLHSGKTEPEESNVFTTNDSVNEQFGAEIPNQGITQAIQQPKAPSVDEKAVLSQPSPSGTVCNLSEDQTKSLMAGIGARESGSVRVILTTETQAKYTTVNDKGIKVIPPLTPQYEGYFADDKLISNYENINTIGYIGKYQFGVAALEDLGYIKPGTYKARTGINFIMDDPNVWTNKDGIRNKTDFLNSHDIQEKIMFNYMNQNCTTMTRIGAISENDPSDVIGGMIMVAHKEGAGGAKEFRAGDDLVDGFGTTSSEYYNIGSGSVKYVDNNEKIVSAGS